MSDQFDYLRDAAGAMQGPPTPAPGQQPGGDQYDYLRQAASQASPAASRQSLRPMTPQEEQSFLGAAKAAGSTNQATLPQAAAAVGNRAAAMARGGADILSMGTSDRILAGLGAATGIGGTKGDYAGNLAAQRQADLQDPTARLVGQGIGALALPGAASTLPRAIGLGAAQGGLYGAGSSPDYRNIPQVAQNAVTGAGIGAAAGGAGGLAAGAAERLLGAETKAAPAVTAANIEGLKNAAYAKADQLGAAYTPEAYGKMVAKIASDAKDANISADVNPLATSAIKNLQEDVAARTESGTPISLSELDNKRKMISRRVAASNVGEEQFLGRKMIRNVDEFVSNSGPENMAAGAAPDAAAAIQAARDLNTRFEKTKTLEEAGGKAERRSWFAGGTEDKTRARLIQAFEKSGNWTPEETAAFESVFQGTAGQRLLHRVGGFAPNSVVKALLEGGGLIAAGPAAAAIPIAGLAAKALASRAAKGNVKQLAETILAGKGGTVATKFGKYPRTRAGARALAAAMTAKAIGGSQ